MKNKMSKKISINQETRRKIHSVIELHNLPKIHDRLERDILGVLGIVEPEVLPKKTITISEDEERRMLFQIGNIRELLGIDLSGANKNYLKNASTKDHLLCITDRQDLIYDSTKFVGCMLAIMFVICVTLTIMIFLKVYHVI